VIALLRRTVGLLLAVFLMSLAVAATGLGSGAAVVADYEDNGQIDACYTPADFAEALTIVRADQQQYGAAADIIQQKQLDCQETVQTAPAADDDSDDGGSGTLLVVGLFALVAVAAVGAFTYLRRRGPDGDA
jgi:nitrate reductase NapE component